MKLLLSCTNKLLTILNQKKQLESEFVNIDSENEEKDSFSSEELPSSVFSKNKAQIKLETNRTKNENKIRKKKKEEKRTK